MNNERRTEENDINDEIMNNKQTIKTNSEEQTMDRGEKRALFRFRRWPVYIGAKSFRKEMRQVAKNLPERERYLLRAQMSRAADSICLNIAEGSNKLSDIELSKYLNISETSLEEVVCCLDLILDDGYITEDVFERYLKEAEGLGAQLIAFGRKVPKQGIRL
jgi:four helix bundle protein